MEEEVSKSQRKREADALQKLGLKLVAMKPIKLDSLSLPQPLYKAIIDAKSIKSHGAKRRQDQLIGKLMRALEPELIFASYNKVLEDDICVKELLPYLRFPIE